MKFTTEFFSDKMRLLASEVVTRDDGSTWDKLVWVGEAYNDQLALLKRECKKATGHKVNLCQV